MWQRFKIWANAIYAILLVVLLLVVVVVVLCQLEEGSSEQVRLMTFARQCAKLSRRHENRMRQMRHAMSTNVKCGNGGASKKKAKKQNKPKMGRSDY